MSKSDVVEVLDGQSGLIVRLRDGSIWRYNFLARRPSNGDISTSYGVWERLPDIPVEEGP